MAAMKPLDKGSQVWYIFKAVEAAVALTIILLLILGQYVYTTVDDFTPVRDVQSATSKKGIEPVRRYCTTETPRVRNYKPKMTSGPQTTTTIPPLVEPQPQMNLSGLLVIYPSSVTITVVTLIEILGEVLKDPLNKQANSILALLCISLTTTILIVSLSSALTTFHITTIIISVLSGVLLTFQVVEFILLLFS